MTHKDPQQFLTPDSNTEFYQKLGADLPDRRLNLLDDSNSLAELLDFTVYSRHASLMHDAGKVGGLRGGKVSSALEGTAKANSRHRERLEGGARCLGDRRCPEREWRGKREEWRGRAGHLRSQERSASGPPRDQALTHQHPASTQEQDTSLLLHP